MAVEGDPKFQEWEKAEQRRLELIAALAAAKQKYPPGHIMIRDAEVAVDQATAECDRIIQQMDRD